MDKNEADGVPSVIDMLEELNAYEQAMVDTELSETSSRPEALLLSLKRTKIDIRHRDIVLKDVPGLQFVVERRVGLAAPHEVDEALISKMKGFKQRVPERARSSSLDTGHPIPGSYVTNGVGMQREPIVVSTPRKRLASRLGSNGGTESQIRNNSITSVTKSEFEAKSEPPFASLEGLVVIDKGMIADTDGNRVGVVVKGDTKALIGCTTDEYVDVMNKYGEVKGHAEPYEEYEGEAIGRAFSHTDDIWSDDGTTIGQSEILHDTGTQSRQGGSSDLTDVVNHSAMVHDASMAPSDQPGFEPVPTSPFTASEGLSWPETERESPGGMQNNLLSTRRAEGTAPDNAELSYESLMYEVNQRIMKPTNERPNIPFRLDRRETLEEERVSGPNTAFEVEGRYVAEKGSLIPSRYHYQQRLIYYRQSHVTSSGTGARDENSLEQFAFYKKSERKARNKKKLSPRCSSQSPSGKGAGGSQMSKHASGKTEELPTGNKPPIQPRVSSIESDVYRIMTFD